MPNVKFSDNKSDFDVHGERAEMSIGDENHTCVHCGDNDHLPGCPDGAIIAELTEEFARNGWNA